MLGWSYSIKINDCFFLVLNKSTEIIKAATLKVLIEWFVESSILLIKQNKKWIIWRRQQIKRSWLAITRYVPENQKGMWARRQDRSWFIECSVLVTLCLAVCCYPCDYFTCRWIELWEGMCKSQLCVEVVQPCGITRWKFASLFCCCPGGLCLWLAWPHLSHIFLVCCCGSIVTVSVTASVSLDLSHLAPT